MKKHKERDGGKFGIPDGIGDPADKVGSRWRASAWRQACGGTGSGTPGTGRVCACGFGLAMLVGQVALGQAPQETGDSEVTAQPSTLPAAERVQTGPSGRLQRETSVRTESEEELPYHLHFLWESRYVSEGRDNLEGGGLISVASEMDFGLLTFNPWYAQGYDSDYDELNLNFVLGFKPNEKIELYAGYTHLRFFKDNQYDNEVGAGLVLSYLDWADFFATNTYSFDAGGCFIETGLSRELALSDELTLKAIGLLGINEGYMAEGHDGGNNLQLLLEASYKVNRHLELTMFAGYSWAIDPEPERFADDGALYDFFWGGAGLIVHF